MRRMAGGANELLQCQRPDADLNIMLGVSDLLESERPYFQLDSGMDIPSS